MTLKQVLKSKTIDVNAAAGALLPILLFFGVEMTAGEVGAFFVIVNIALRFFTKTAVIDK